MVLIRGIMILGMDPDPELNFQLLGDSGSGSSRKRNHNTSNFHQKKNQWVTPPIQVYLRESWWARAGVLHGQGGDFVPGVVEGRASGPVQAGVALALIQLDLASPA